MCSHSHKGDGLRIEFFDTLENNKDVLSEAGFSKIYQIEIYSDLMGWL